MAETAAASGWPLTSTSWLPHCSLRQSIEYLPRPNSTIHCPDRPHLEQTLTCTPCGGRSTSEDEGPGGGLDPASDATPAAGAWGFASTAGSAGISAATSPASTHTSAVT